MKIPNASPLYPLILPDNWAKQNRLRWLDVGGFGVSPRTTLFPKTRWLGVL